MAGGRLSWVRANDNQIMALLEDQVDNLVKATSVLAESMSNYGTQIEKNSILKELEHEGDHFTHKVFTTIDKTFITPLDKEDISELTSTIDQVLDATYGTSDRFVLFKIQEPCYKEIICREMEDREKYCICMDYHHTCECCCGRSCTPNNKGHILGQLSQI
jgi:uncharacterized protein Yka (UPF0111/DUF47 family)